VNDPMQGEHSAMMMIRRDGVKDELHEKLWESGW
jgi:hypothetical protein